MLPRQAAAEKSDFGHTLVLAGSPGFSGAAILSSRAAVASGSGLVTLGVPRGLGAWIARRSIPEVMLRVFPSTTSGTLSCSAMKSILDYVEQKRIRCVALGPGLSVERSTTLLVRHLIQKLTVTTVLDADGLNAFAGRPALFKSRRGELILTPHRRELERVFGTPYPGIQRLRVALAIKLSKIYDVVLVLKGERTVVASPAGHVYVNNTGNPGMAKGGCGDALTGIIAAFVSQGLSAFEAARWGVYYHGRAADIAVRIQGELGLRASDIIEYLPNSFR